MLAFQSNVRVFLTERGFQIKQLLDCSKYVICLMNELSVSDKQSSLFQRMPCKSTKGL